MNPLISIGIPVHNGERSLKRALDGILSQDYDNFEVLVSDNFSSDNTLEILSEYEKRLKLKIIRQDSLISITENFKAVLNMAEGKYFLFHAHDDYLSPSFLSENIKLLECNPNMAVSQSAARLFDTDTGVELRTVNILKKGESRLKGLSLVFKVFSPVKINYYIYGVFRRDLLNLAYSNCPEMQSADRFFLLQFASSIYEFGYVDSPLYHRAVTEVPLIKRYPFEKLAQQIEYNKTHLNLVEPVVKIQKMLSSSRLVKINLAVRVLIVILLLKRVLQKHIRNKLRLLALRIFPSV